MSVDPADLAEHLGLPEDPRMVSASEAATSWAEKRRSNTEPTDLWAEPDVTYGATLYAALLYQSRSAPQGFSGYDETGVYSSSQEALFRARDLVGSDPVIA
jgi:hypothetical protein